VGLALVRRIVELHGGRVQALSEGPGRGADVVVEIPRSLSPLRLEATAAFTPGDVPASVRVLVVDDNHDAADSLSMMLRQMGLEARTAHDGASALRLCEAFHPHLVLLDIGMPGMNGYEVARAIRSLKVCGDPLIAAVTGWGQESDKARAREAGFDQHFTKPISEQALHLLLAEAAATIQSAS
jgi:CheY-like chemotaxis protein